MRGISIKRYGSERCLPPPHSPALIDFLSRYGLKPLAAIKAYGDEALAAVKDNPYIMVDEQFGAGFEADTVATGSRF